MSRKRSCTIASTLAALLFLPAVSGQTAGERVSKADHARSLNTQLLGLYDEFRGAGPERRSGMHKEIAALVEKRATMMSDLVQKDPDTALQFAFSQELLDGLAQDFPEAARRLESRGVWQGQADIWIQDAADMKSSKATIKLRSGKERLDVVFGGGAPKDLRCGSTLTVSGVRSGTAIAAENAKVSYIADATASPCGTTGVQNIAVLLVTFPGVTPTISSSAVYNLMFGSGNRSLNGYWQEVSYGQTSATGNVFGWYTLPTAFTCDQYQEMQVAAMALAANDVSFNNYGRIFIVFPLPAGCTYGGIGTIGCTTVTSVQGSFTASVSWMVADYLNPNDQGVEIAAHEGGHNPGLWHSESRGFGSTTPLGPLGTAGTINEYGDNFSPMGYYNLGHYAAQQKYQLGWLNSGNVMTVSASGNYLMAPYERVTAGVQALQIQRGIGNNDWLWLEYRQPIGNYDTTLSSQIFSGAMIRYFDSITGSYTNLLNYTPADSNWLNPALAAGKNWVDPNTNLSVAVQSATSTGLAVNVNYGTPTCTPANPVVTMSPANPSVMAGSTTNYTVTIQNMDSTACSPSPFGVSSTQPSGWAASLSAGSVSLSPGSSTTVTLKQTPPAGTAPGTYPVSAMASRSPQAAVGTANCSVMTAPPPISLTVSMSASTYTARSTVSTTAKVLSGTSAVSGASVTFTMTAPNGSTTSGTATTNSTGQATWNYKLGPKDSPGVYSMKATATSGSQTAATPVTTFTVQ